MNQTDSMLIHADLLRNLFGQFVGIEYARQLDKLQKTIDETEFDKEPTDDEDSRLIDPGSLQFAVDVDRAFKVANEAANVFCLSTGFAEWIPADDRRRGGPLMRAAVPKQFRGGVPSIGKKPSTVDDRGMSPAEAVAMVNGLVETAFHALAPDENPDGKEAKLLIAELRHKFSKSLRQNGVAVPLIRKPPEMSGRKPFDWEDPDDGEESEES